MKSKVLASVAALMAVGATCAFAANPFVDVPTDSWAYKSVVELADAGIIQGVDGSYFQGERNITRYEAAEMVAKAMAHMDRATVEQRALINKLADEYADEYRISKTKSAISNSPATLVCVIVIRIRILIMTALNMAAKKMISLGTIVFASAVRRRSMTE